MISIDSNLQVTQGNIFGRQLVWKSANLHKQAAEIHSPSRNVRFFL